MKIIKFFRGKKAYLIGILMILLGFLTDNMQVMLEGAGIMAIRGGIAKIK